MGSSTSGLLIIIAFGIDFRSGEAVISDVLKQRTSVNLDRYKYVHLLVASGSRWKGPLYLY